MEKLKGKVFSVNKGTDEIGASFHIRTEEGSEVWVTVRGELLRVVKPGANVVAYGKWSMAMGGFPLERFAATEVMVTEDEDCDIKRQP